MVIHTTVPIASPIEGDDVGSPNLKLRGGSYHWRRKITVAGKPLPLSISLRTGQFARARLISARLSVTVESLRMAYGQFTGVTSAQLKRVFGDTLRWQLQRIEQDQALSVADPGDHATVNSVHAEAWEFLAKNGVDAAWTLDERDRLIDSGWSSARAKQVGNLVFDAQTGEVASGDQIIAYCDGFGINRTKDNIARVKQMICQARAAACREATARLSTDGNSVEDWIEDALQDDTPFAFERSVAAPPAQPASTEESVRTSGDEDQRSSTSVRPTKSLIAACEEAAAKHQKGGDWDESTVRQVKTAVRLFDHACGPGIHIEDLKQSHVRLFTELCAALPNRWGRTRAEQAGGIEASLDRATSMPPGDIGLGQATINKHISWITAVLDHAAGENDDPDGHRPPTPLSFKSARKGSGKGPRRDRKRKRDQRANWTKQEIEQLLSAPIWTGAGGIDRRLKTGDEIIHDAWYWMPLMLPLYGGRSSELAGLGLTEVHEGDAVPHFVIDYTEDRPLKNVQSVRKLPIHPELIRLGFIDYVTGLREAGCTMLFPELASPGSRSFASTFYKTVFDKHRAWAFPQGTEWRHRVKGAWKDKDVHSYRGLSTSMLKGRVSDSLRCDIFGHEGETETARTYDDEADLELKRDALTLLTPLTEHIPAQLPIKLRPLDRLKHGVPRSRSRVKASSKRPSRKAS